MVWYVAADSDGWRNTHVFTHIIPEVFQNCLDLPECGACCWHWWVPKDFKGTIGLPKGCRQFHACLWYVPISREKVISSDSLLPDIQCWICRKRRGTQSWNSLSANLHKKDTPPFFFFFFLRRDKRGDELRRNAHSDFQLRSRMIELFRLSKILLANAWRLIFF